MTTQARVTCPKCGQSVSLNMNNRLQPHGKPRCEASRLRVWWDRTGFSEGKPGVPVYETLAERA